VPLSGQKEVAMKIPLIVMSMVSAMLVGLSLIYFVLVPN
jgi:hypothetical protein